MSNVKTLFSRKYLKKIRIYRNNYCNNNNNCNDKNGVIEKKIVKNFSKKYIYENICWMCCSITPGIMSFIFLILNWILHKPIKDKFNKTKEELNKIDADDNIKIGKTLNPDKLVKVTDNYLATEIRQARLIYHVSKWISTFIGGISTLIFIIVFILALIIPANSHATLFLILYIIVSLVLSVGFIIIALPITAIIDVCGGLNDSKNTELEQEAE